MAAEQPIALACDHAGLELKNHLLSVLKAQGHACRDFGTHSAARCDAIDFAVPACEAVLAGECACALLFCGTGVAMSMVANKLPGMRACCCSDTFSAEYTRRHNNANALCLGGRVVGFGLGEKLVVTFLKTAFEGGVYQQRNEKMAKLEQTGRL
jgi:ribose 5-phosphate isomerase B